MTLNFEIILNVFIAMFFYNIVLKSIGTTIIKHMLNSKVSEEHKKSFKEKLEEKLKERETVN